MRKQKLLIADNDDIFRTALADALKMRYEVLCCRDGKEALSLLQQENPDIFVLDLLLPKLDGISLLHAAAQAGIFPKIFAVTSFFNTYILNALAQLDIFYLMRKPCDIAATVARIDDPQPELSLPAKCPASSKIAVIHLLHTLGIPAKLDGYTYLQEAIVLFIQDPSQSITKELYPAVARRCGSAAMHVERSIRNAISAAWCCHDDALWQQIFPANSSGCLSRPTNGTFISQLAEYLRLQEERNAC